MEVLEAQGLTKSPFPVTASSSPRHFQVAESMHGCEHLFTERVAETRRKMRAKEELAQQRKLQVWQKRDARLRKFLEKQVFCLCFDTSLALSPLLHVARDVERVCVRQKGGAMQDGRLVRYL